MTWLKPALAFALVAVGLTFAVGLAACGGDDDGDESGNGTAEIPTTPESGGITMGIQPWIGYGPWYIAEEEGYFADEGIEVNLTNFTADDDLNAAFAAGRMEVSNVATHTALKLIEAGLDANIVLLEDVATDADAILAGPDISSIEDLRGERVAYEEGATSDILLRYALQESGMTIDDIETVPIPASDAGSAAIAGRVPAAVTYEPYLTIALNEDPEYSMLYTAGENPGLISDVLIASGDALAERPGQLVALMRAWNSAIEFYRSDTDRAQQIIADAVGADLEELETAFDGVEFFDLAENLDELPGRFQDEVMPEVAAVGVDAGILEGQPELAGIVDPRFVEAAGE